MTYANLANSRKESAPFDLYKFEYGTGADDFYAYTTAERPVDAGGVRYEPLAIRRGAVTLSGSQDKTTLDIRLPKDSKPARLFRYGRPSSVIRLTILQGELADPGKQVRLVWVGRIVSSTLEDKNAVLAGEPDFTSLNRVGLRRNYQYGCPHALFGKRCRADETAATRSTQIVTLVDATVTLPPGWAEGTDTEKFVSGVLSYQGVEGVTERVSIIRSDGEDSLTLGHRPRGLVPGASVDIVLGCNRQQDDCRDLHGNILNFGGMGWIPEDNPFGLKNNYY